MMIKTQYGQEIGPFKAGCKCGASTYPNTIWVMLIGEDWQAVFQHDDCYIFKTMQRRFLAAIGDDQVFFDFQEEFRQLEEWRDDVINNPDITF